jgi:3-dehydroquinate dehydratase/shikimate dehydrogenase
VDVERGSTLAGEFLHAPGFADRLILSDHGASCTTRDLLPVYREMAETPAAVLKIVPRAGSPLETVAVHDLLAKAADDGRRLATFALGRAGALSRLLAPSWGSWAVYGSVRRGEETAEGQFTVEELEKVYRVDEIGSSTHRFALVGSAVFGSPSPAMHRAGYRRIGMDAAYLPVEVDRLEDFAQLRDRRELFGFEAFAVTMPFKEQVAATVDPADRLAASAGAVNTVLFERERWRGYNTDGPAALERIRRRLDPNGLRVAILGAGGTARAVAVALSRAGARVTLYNRNEERAAAAARRLEVESAPQGELDRRGWDVLVNATPQGSGGESFLDPGRLTGRLVLDAVYRRGSTPLVRQARRKGLDAIDGLELLAAQAAMQFERMTGHAVPFEPIHAAGMQWLEGRSA